VRSPHARLARRIGASWGASRGARIASGRSAPPNAIRSPSARALDRYASHTGTFATVLLPTLGGGLGWEVEYGDTFVRLASCALRSWSPAT